MKPRRICQTGFNYGTSALAFLCGSPDSVVYSWDIDHWAYVRPAERWLRGRYGKGRVVNIYGDSLDTLRDLTSLRGLLAERGEDLPLCDLVLVDGYHGRGGAYQDLLNLRHISRPEAVVIIDDCKVFDIFPWIFREVNRAQREEVLTRLDDGAEVGAGLPPLYWLRGQIEDNRNYCVGKFRA